MRQYTLCAALRQVSGNAAVLGLLLIMPFAVPHAHAAPNQARLGRSPQVQTQMPSQSQTEPNSAVPVMNHSRNQVRTYSDRAFLSGMIAHHEGAVNMADQLLQSPRNALDPQVARWAREIREAQTEEIMDMQAMLRTVGGLDKAAYQDMQRQMKEMMEQGRGLEPNTRFVTLMIPHHADAVEMALPALLYSDSRRIAHLAQDIIEEQSEEIATFRDWLSRKHHPL